MMNKSFLRRSMLAASVLLLGSISQGSFAAAPVKADGDALVGANGMTLYTLDKDVAGSGKSECNGPCAANWPALMAGEADVASADYTIIARDEGKKQWAYKGKPLYFWSKDAKPGERTGDGFNKVWHVAKP
jgi:predicted lipoprotein with Yx(FWY)xxD motif